MDVFSRSKQTRRATHATLIGHTGYARCHRVARMHVPSAPTSDSAESLRQAEIEQDLLLARDIQQGLLLEAVPRLPGWEISAVSLPARDLGGDLYDFLMIDSKTHGIMIGDVSGKGLPAALRMAVARTVFRHEARRGRAPALALAGVNRGVLRDIPQGMVTMLYTTLDLQSGMLQIANAGHNYPVVLSSLVSEVELTGLPLGVDGDSDYGEVAHRLNHGDTVFFYTDGVIEAINPAGEIYGFERLEQLLRAHVGAKPRALVARLLHELRAWSGGTQADDITLVVVRRRYASVGEELRLAAIDVLGSERAAALWSSLALPERDAGARAWAELVPEITGRAQAQFGRGSARELSGQLRLVLEEYR